MLSVLLNWIYIIGTAFCLGCGFSALCGKLFDYRLKRLDSLLMAGVGIATVYAQIFSLFGGVGLMANLLLAAACVGILLLCGKDMKEWVMQAWKSYKPAKRVLLLVVIGLWAYFTSRGYIHYDTDLYHAQSIRWIEEYGVVPGLGNLHERFAYNSSFFAVSALYSMKFLTGESLHAVSGFFALLLSITALDITKSWKRHKFILSDYARVGAIYYLTTIVDEVVSPATDYSIMCVIFFIIIKWLDLLEQEEKEIAPYALLCVAGVYALTLKLTAGLILLLLIKPAYLLIKEKRVKQIFLYLGMGLLTAIPWFVRTVVISGWLVYPLPSLDLFSFDWEMDAALIEVDAAQISVWGKALYNVALADTPATQWIPNWFRTTLSGTEKLLILSCVLCIVLFVIRLIWICAKKQWKQLDVVLVLFTVICSYTFWQMSAPLLRYGYAYVLLVDFLMVGWILMQIGWNRLENVVYFVLILYGAYKLFNIGEYIYSCRLVDCYIWQAEYGSYELETYEVGGVTFYKPVQGDKTGYEYFPATPVEADIELRGNGLKDGFRRRK
ncbi:MAG: hypothetical protein IJ379_06510 [Lachnospiraceae bacterium]|nr:hypothetical protein [Lachnospiraceae bacterium]